MRKQLTNGQSQLPLNELTNLAGWAKLQEAEQELIRTETLLTEAALRQVGEARLSAGEHLLRVQEVLKAGRVFTQYLELMFHMSRATGYRYINNYKAAKTVLPVPVLKVAMMRPNDKLNYELIKATPPPKTTDIVKINEYLDTVQGPNRQPREEKTPAEIEKDCYRFCSLRISTIPKNKKRSVLADHVGMLMTFLGISNEMTFKPIAIPQGFKTTIGRPRTKAIA
jgi:hypothetical protein